MQRKWKWIHLDILWINIYHKGSIVISRQLKVHLNNLSKVDLILEILKNEISFITYSLHTISLWRQHRDIFFFNKLCHVSKNDFQKRYFDTKHWGLGQVGENFPIDHLAEAADWTIRGPSSRIAWNGPPLNINQSFLYRIKPALAVWIAVEWRLSFTRLPASPTSGTNALSWFEKNLKNAIQAD